MRASTRLWRSFAKFYEKELSMDSVRHLEGVFAINKPSGLSSAQVLRDLQERFNPSETFSPWLTAERARLETESGANSKQRFQPRKKRWEKKHSRIKIGHGGTLDPLAKGVLIAGLGSGTKALGGFLGCTKTYETVVLFGVATDSYDGAGKIVKRSSLADVQSITKDRVEEALAKFQGQILQRPPIYSALHIQGKRLYEYARERIAVPVEIPERSVMVESLEMVEWLQPGTHEFKPPEEEVGDEDRVVAENLLAAANTGVVPASQKKESGSGESVSTVQAENGTKRKLSPSAEETVDSTKKTKTEASTDAATLVGAETASSGLDTSSTADEAGPIAAVAGAVASSTAAAAAAVSAVTADKATSPASSQAMTAKDLPAIRLRMTVSSGFYVRSLAQDLGVAVGGLAFMADLVRTRQERFELGAEDVLDYEELTKGEEEVWGPKVLRALERWNKARAQESWKQKSISSPAQPEA